MSRGIIIKNFVDVEGVVWGASIVVEQQARSEFLSSGRDDAMTRNN